MEMLKRLGRWKRSWQRGSVAEEQVKYVPSLHLWWYLHHDVMAMPIDLRLAGSRCVRCCTVGGGVKGGNIKKWVLRATDAEKVYEEAGGSRDLLGGIKP